MNKAKVWGVVAALLSLGGLISLLTTGLDVPVSQLPYEALQGLAFTFGWGLGFPTTLAYGASLLLIVVVLLIGFLIGYKLCRWLSS